jgi:hypothetical protein
VLGKAEGEVGSQMRSQLQYLHNNSTGNSPVADDPGINIGYSISHPLLARLRGSGKVNIKLGPKYHNITQASHEQDASTVFQACRTDA